MVELNLLEATRAVFASALSANDKLVALALLNHWSKSRETFPSVARLADWTSLSRCSVMRSIKRLTASGAIGVAGEKGRANRYDLAHLTSLQQRPVSHSDQSQGDTPPVSHSDGSSLPQRPDQSPGETRSDPVSDPVSDPEKRSTTPAELEVFEFWGTTLWSKVHEKGKPRATESRLKHIRARLKRFTVEQAKMAIRNVAASEFMVSNGHVEPENFMRSDEKLESWLVRKPKGPSVQREGTDESVAQQWGKDGARELEAE